MRFQTVFFAIAVTGTLWVAFFVQFFWHVLLGEEPAITSLGEFLPFLLVAVAVAAVAFAFARFLPRWGTWIVLVIGVLYAAFWVMALADSLRYGATSMLLAVRSVGLATSGFAVVYGVRRLSAKRGRW